VIKERRKDTRKEDYAGGEKKGRKMKEGRKEGR
jgi:hypothetical protein